MWLMHATQHLRSVLFSFYFHKETDVWSMNQRAVSCDLQILIFIDKWFSFLIPASLFNTLTIAGLFSLLMNCTLIQNACVHILLTKSIIFYHSA